MIMDNCMMLSDKPNAGGEVDFIANKTKGEYINLGGINRMNVIDCVHHFLCKHHVWDADDTVIHTTKLLSYIPSSASYHNISFILAFYDAEYKKQESGKIIESNKIESDKIETDKIDTDKIESDKPVPDKPVPDESVTLKNNYDTLESDYDSLENDFESLKNNYDLMESDYKLLEEDYKSLESQCEQFKNECKISKANLENVINSTISSLQEHAKTFVKEDD